MSTNFIKRQPLWTAIFESVCCRMPKSELVGDIHESDSSLKILTKSVEKEESYCVSKKQIDRQTEGQWMDRAKTIGFLPTLVGRALISTDHFNANEPKFVSS